MSSRVVGGLRILVATATMGILAATSACDPSATAKTADRSAATATPSSTATMTVGTPKTNANSTAPPKPSPRPRSAKSADDPKVKTSRPADPLASATIPPVIRDGKVSHPTVKAKSEPFDRPVRYPDGLSLRITGIKQGTVTEQGPGELPGQPMASFSMTMSNSGIKPVVLNQVVVTAIYGAPARLARPVYDDTTQDFSGTIGNGHNAKAVYVFSVPTADLDNVTVLVDFDGRHTAATFRGAAK